MGDDIECFAAPEHACSGKGVMVFGASNSGDRRFGDFLKQICRFKIMLMRPVWNISIQLVPKQVPTAITHSKSVLFVLFLCVDLPDQRLAFLPSG